MSVQGDIPAAMVDGQMLAVAGAAGVPHKEDGAALDGVDLGAQARRNIQAGVVAGAGPHAGIGAPPKGRSDESRPIQSGEGAAKGALLQRGLVVLDQAANITVGAGPRCLVAVVQEDGEVIGVIAGQLLLPLWPSVS